MRLSEAITLGAMLHPQGRGNMTIRRRRWFGLFGPMEVRETCALGAAYQAVGGGSHEEVATAPGTAFRGRIAVGEITIVLDTPSEWNRVFFTHVACPQCGDLREVKQLIPHLNDDHRWKREDIALFIEKVEQQVLGPVAPAERVDALDEALEIEMA